jgi:hypothetical protein
VIGTAVPRELLLVALHGLSPQPGGTLADAQDPGSTVFSVLTGTFILVLTAGAAVLMAHMQSPSLLQAADGDAEWVTQDIPSLLGRPARSFEQFTAGYAAAFF